MDTPMTTAPADAGRAPLSVDRVAEFFETLSPQSVDAFGTVYAADARFKDPFNEVQGLPAICHIFRHMYEVLDDPRFVVTGRMAQGDQMFLAWDFHFRFRRFKRERSYTIRGATHLRIDAQGLICVHRDYWDAAEELYEKLPLVGALMRWLRRQAQS